MNDAIKCASCGATRLSPVTRVANYRYFGVEFYKSDAKKGIFQDDSIGAEISRGRVCLECGLVTLYARPSDLAKLVEHEDKLESKKLAPDVSDKAK
jgi:hypothetical protein